MNLEDIEERFKKRLKEAALKEIIDIRKPLIITNLSLPPRIKYGVNSGGSPVISRDSGFLLSQE